MRRGLGVGAADTQVDSAHTHGLEVLENLSRHAYGKIDETVIPVDVDVSYVAAVQPGLVCKGADDVSRLHSVRIADFDAECLEPRAALGAAGRSLLTRWPGVGCSSPARTFVRVMERFPRGVLSGRPSLRRPPLAARAPWVSTERVSDLEGGWPAPPRLRPLECSAHAQSAR